MLITDGLAPLRDRRQRRCRSPRYVATPAAQCRGRGRPVARCCPTLLRWHRWLDSLRGELGSRRAARPPGRATRCTAHEQRSTGERQRVAAGHDSRVLVCRRSRPGGARRGPVACPGARLVGTVGAGRAEPRVGRKPDRGINSARASDYRGRPHRGAPSCRSRESSRRVRSVGNGRRPDSADGIRADRSPFRGTDRRTTCDTGLRPARRTIASMIYPAWPLPPARTCRAPDPAGFVHCEPVGRPRFEPGTY